MEGWVKAVIFLFAYFFVIGTFDWIALEIIGEFNESKIAGTDYYYIHSFVTSPNNLPWLIFYQSLQFTGVVILFFVNEKGSNHSRSVNLKNLVYYFFQGTLLGALLIVVITLTLYILIAIEIVRIDFSFSLLLEYFFLFLLVAVVEEFFFRRIFLKNLLLSISTGYAIILSSLMFSFIHCLNANFTFLAFINLFLAGALFSLLFVITQNIWTCVGLHWVWNFLQGPVLGFNLSGLEMDSLLKLKIDGDILITGHKFGLEGSAICTLVLVFCILALSIYMNRKKVNIQINA